MNSNLVRCLILTILAALCGCASAPSTQTPLNGVALIHGVKENQSRWLIGLTAVFFARVVSISDASTGQVVTAPYLRQDKGLFYVPPGTYIARVKCNSGGYPVSFNTVIDFPPVTARAGYEYQLMCSGNLRNMIPVISEIPHAGA